MLDMYKLLYRIASKLKITNLLSDKVFLKFQFRALMGTELDLNNPITFNQKLNWMKLFDRNPLYTRLVDKIAVKKWVSEKVGNQDLLIPTLGVYNSLDDININELPGQFVLKTSHSGDSLGVVICKDKKKFNSKVAFAQLNKSLNIDYYKPGREWPYKNVPRRIIAEKYMEDEFGELRDYKFFCFNGEVKALFVATNRSTGHVCFDYFDQNFNHLDFIQSHSNFDAVINKPKKFEKMVSIASLLSKGLPHVRVDLYNINGCIYFGEMTFYHYGGVIAFHPEEWDYKFGEWIDLSLCYNNKKHE